MHRAYSFLLFLFMAAGLQLLAAGTASAQLMQEAAVVLMQGGGFQIYHTPTRSGFIVESIIATRSFGRAITTLRAGDLELDPQTRIVHLAGKSIPLSQRELALLEHLMRRPGAIVSKANLEGSIYGWGEEVESNTIEVHISNLRKKLGTERIITVRGVGYQVAAK